MHPACAAAACHGSACMHVRAWHLQVSSFTDRQNFTQNYLPGPAAEAALLELLRAPGVSGITLRSQEQVTSMQVRNGK